MTRSRAAIGTILPVALSFVVADACAGPPDSRPLKADEGGRDVAAPADEEDSQLFYYSDGRKVYLDETGLAVARLKPGVTPDRAGVRPLALAPGDPMKEVVPSLERAGIVLIGTEAEGPRGLNLLAARSDVFDYVLPVVVAARRAAEPEARHEAPAQPTQLIMTTRIAARFGPAVAVPAFVEPFDLRVAERMRGDVYALELAGGPPTYSRLIQAANRLYERGRPDGSVLYAHPDFVPVRRKAQDVGDPRFGNQWHLHNSPAGGGGVPDVDVDALEAWTFTLGNGAICIAIIDDSVQRDHPDLAGNYQTGRYYNAWSGQSDDPSPKTGTQNHGTPCAGVSVATANDLGVRGVAPVCGLIGVHVWEATSAQTADAFRFCVDPDGVPDTDDGAAVISCSWSWNSAFDVVRDAVDEVATQSRGGRGAVVLFAAANDYYTVAANQWFGTLESVICVGATNWRDDHSLYSNHGPEVDVVAPSSDSGYAAWRIDTTDNSDSLPYTPGLGYAGRAPGDYTGNGLTGFGGTSSATPLAAGVCGLILSVNPALTAVQVRAILEHTADRLTGELRRAAYDLTTSHDEYYGYGRVNAKKALLVAQASITDPDAVWPDHITNVRVMRDSTSVELQWDNPQENLCGLLVVRSDAPLQWKPHDGDRFLVGDIVANGEGRVISVGTTSSLTDPSDGSDVHYGIFACNGDHRYSWGTKVSSSAPADSQVAGAGH